MRSGLTTSVRLGLLALSAVVGIAVVGLFGVFEIAGMGRQLHDDLKGAQTESAAMLEIKTTQSMFLLQVKAFKDVLLRGNDAERYSKHVQEFKDRQVDVASHLDAAIKWMKAAGIATGEAEALKAAHAELSGKYLEALNGFDKQDAEAGKKADQLVRGIDRPTNEKLNKLVADVEQHARQQAAMQMEAADRKSRRNEWIFAIIVLAGAAAMASMAVSIRRVLMKQLGGDPAYASQIVSGIAQGNLTEAIKLEAGDTSSLLASMAGMQTNLRQVIGDIHRAAEAVGDAAKQLASTAGQVAEGSNQQSDSSSSMAAAIEELTVSIGRIAEHSDTAHGLSSDARHRSSAGAENIRRTIDGINAASAALQGAMQAVYRLGEQSASIAGILNVIREIADQTNLLALNAAIEAARAGEQGRGFAVVADEVRKLAEKTGASTQEISDMIAAIQDGVGATIRQMEDGTSQVAASIDEAANTGTSMREIDGGAIRVLEAVNEISAALREQSGTATDISQRVEAIAQLAEENRAAVAEVSSATHHLEDLAQKLYQSVSRFQV